MQFAGRLPALRFTKRSLSTPLRVASTLAAASNLYPNTANRDGRGRSFAPGLVGVSSQIIVRNSQASNIWLAYLGSPRPKRGYIRLTWGVDVGARSVIAPAVDALFPCSAPSSWPAKRLNLPRRSWLETTYNDPAAKKVTRKNRPTNKQNVRPAALTAPARRFSFADAVSRCRELLALERREGRRIDNLQSLSGLVGSLVSFCRSAQ
jgi:hypothetical protein